MYACSVIVASMNQTQNTIVDSLLQYGVLGIVCVVFAVVIYRLFGENQKRQVELTELHNLRLKDTEKPLAETQNRLVDSHAYSEKLIQITAKVIEVVTNNTQALNARKETDESMRDALAKLAEIVQKK